MVIISSKSEDQPSKTVFTVKFNQFMFFLGNGQNGSSRCFLAKNGCTLKTIAAEIVVGRI